MAATEPAGPFSAFGALSASPFDRVSSTTSQATEDVRAGRAASAGLHTPRRSLGRQKSLGLEHAHTAPPGAMERAGSRGQRPQLWRDSTAVTERAASLGLSSVRGLCGPTFVDNSRLRNAKPMGEGAFAGERADGGRGSDMSQGVAGDLQARARACTTPCMPHPAFRHLPSPLVCSGGARRAAAQAGR